MTRRDNPGIGPARPASLRLAPPRIAPACTALALAAALVAPAIAHAAPTSLCPAGQTPLFTCPIKQKLVSICADNGKATYYYGTPAKIEMTSQALTTATHEFSGGGEIQITATNHAYTYTVYDSTTRTSFSANGQNDPDFSSGLVVQKNGKTIANTQCGADATISADAAKTIPSGSFIER